MSWIILVIAGLFEIGWAIGLKYTQGFTRLWPALGTVGAMVISVGLLGVAMRELPVGTAYAVWTGIGAVGTVILGIVLFGDPVDLSDLKGRAGEPGVLAEATDRLMAAITALLEELRDEQAPAERWNPAQHGQNETGRLEP